MSEYDESTEWTGHYGSWLQSRGLKRTTDRVEAFHAGYLAQKDEVTRLRAENAELRKLVDLHINTKIVAERVATNFIDRVQKERDELRAQIAEHEKVCAGVWVPCSERLPEDWWIGQVRYPDYSDGMITCRELEAQYISARGFRFTSGTLAVISSSVAEWLDAKQPDEGAQS